MIPLYNSLLAFLFIVSGVAATFIMLELRGVQKDRSINATLVKLHKIFGWIFTCIFILLIIVMIGKIAGYQEEVSSRISFHIVLSLALVPLLFIKIIIARRYPRLSNNLIFFGPSILIFAVALTGITAGYYYIHSSDLRYVSLSEFDEQILDTDIGQQVVNQKCHKCHTLERVYRAAKSEDGWTSTINRMATLDAPNISAFDIKQAIHFLQFRQNAVMQEDDGKLKDAIGKTIMQTKCNVCHELDRIIEADKGKDDWQSTVDQMIEYSGETNYLSKEEEKELIEFLLSK